MASGVRLTLILALASVMSSLITVGRTDPKLALADSSSVSSSSACTSCHAEIVKDWSLSLHRRSFSDPSFQHGYAIEKDAFCKNCHAPDSEHVDDGVACKSCHGAEPHDGGSARAQASCANGGCHEFAFDGATLPAPRSELMQLTVTEHQESGAHAKTECATCHMPKGSHRFDVSRNAKLLRDSLAMNASLEKNNVVHVTLEPRGVGHAFPTGDMFRRLLVRVESGLPGPYARNERRLARMFGPSFTSAKKQMTEDTRLFRTTTLKIPIRPGKDPVTVRVYYQRLTTVGLDLQAGGNPPRERLEDEILIAEHTLYRYD